MKKTVLLFIISTIAICTTIAQQNYNANNIADSLKENADAVLRYYKTSYQRVSAEKYTIEIHYAITILNPDGKNSSALKIYYDRNSKVSNIRGYFYNKNGVLLDKIKKKEIKDYASNNSYTLFSDHRVKLFKPAVSHYPFTMEYKYTIKNSGVVGFDTWIPQKWFNISVEEAELSFSVPKEFDIKYMELNHNFIKNITNLGDFKVYTWSAKNLKAIEQETHISNYLDFMPAILLSPNEIVYEGTKGDFSSWESYGKWVYNLIDGRDELSVETVSFIKELTDTISTKRDKVKAIYKYMQGRTRYVNIALGIGGFQPIPAMEVDEKGYGDCKALSNYTKALLKCAGIVSYYTEIGTGKYQEIKFLDFASSNQTNHIILCVPLENDTVWLECTNQNIPFACITTSSQNRYALLIKPSGGKLVKTPIFDINENTRISIINIEINTMGSADFEITTDFNNNIYEEIFSLLFYSKKKQKRILLKNILSSKRIEIENFSAEDKSEDKAKAKLYIKGKLNNFASKAGKRFFFAPEFFYQNNFCDFDTTKRKLNIYEPISYSYIDSLQIYLPKGYSLENLQNTMQLNSVYGQYSSSVEQNNEIITIVRKISINDGQYDRAQFAEISEFLRNISEYENKKIIICK